MLPEDCECAQPKECYTLQSPHSVLKCHDHDCRRLFSPLRQCDRHTFPRPHGSLAPSTSHSSSDMSIPLHRPTNVLFAFLLISSPEHYPARWCLPFALTTNAHSMSKFMVCPKRPTLWLRNKCHQLRLFYICFGVFAYAQVNM